MLLGRLVYVSSLISSSILGFGAPLLAQPAPAPAPAEAREAATPPAAPGGNPSTTADAALTPAPPAPPAVAAATSPATPIPPGPAAPPAATPAESLPQLEPPKKPGPPAPPQLKLEHANGTSIRFGLLWQSQYEARGNATSDRYSQNLFIRRFALLIGGTVLKDFEYFFDSDFADLFKAPTGEQGLKNGPGFQTKDAFATYRALDERVKLEGGLLLPPGSHNSLQGGGSIYALDFFANTFRHSQVFGSTANPYGRDVGFQARGLVVDGLLEYRAGVFQGRRNLPSGAKPGSRNPFRLAARVQLNFLDPETGFFYSGSYLGTKKILSLGGSVDFQHDDGASYRTYTGDAFLDLPVGPGGATAQINVVHRNGGERLPLAKQTAFMGEAGYRFEPLKLSPIVRYEQRWGEGDAGDEKDLGAGLSFWAYGHTSNLKAFYTRLIPEKGDAFNQFNLQWQVAFY
jgi:hypothetical protein